VAGLLATACASSGGGGKAALSPEEARAVEACFRDADQALRDNRLDRAEAAYTRALDIHPNLPEAYFGRANLLLRRYRLEAEVRHAEAAIRDYGAAIARAPDPTAVKAKALFNRAVAYYQLAPRWPAFYHAAAQDLLRLLEGRDRDAEAHYFLARIYDERLAGMEMDALRHYQRHLELGGGRPDAQTRLLALAQRMPAPPAPAGDAAPDRQ
jgi:tetratricopeptide (TPR) repeat protein